ncbi:MAG: PH domain-containing protein [Pseudomonadota bacterium]
MAEEKKKSGFFKRNNEVDQMLVKGEEVVERAVIHPLGIYWKSIAVFILAVLVSLFVVFELGALLAVTALLMFAYAALKKEILMIVLTNKRMLFRYGILQVDVVDLRFPKIESVELERMPPGYLMGYSNVVIMGTGNRFVAIPYVANGPEIRQAYNRLTLADDDLLEDDEKE